MPKSCVMCALSISTTSALQLLLLVRRMFPLLLHRFIYPVVGRLWAFSLGVSDSWRPSLWQAYTWTYQRLECEQTDLGSACELIWPCGQMLG